MLDTSGDGLHKRGYRKNSMEAPIKETLAAAIIDLGRIYPDTLAQDPFCGSGTLMIEAAMKAMNMAPLPAAPLYGGALCVSACRRLKEQREKASEIRRGVEFQGVGLTLTLRRWRWLRPMQSWRWSGKALQVLYGGCEGFFPCPRRNGVHQSALWRAPGRRRRVSWACWAVGWRKNPVRSAATLLRRTRILSSISAKRPNAAASCTMV